MRTRGGRTRSPRPERHCCGASLSEGVPSSSTRSMDRSIKSSNAKRRATRMAARGEAGHSLCRSLLDETPGVFPAAWSRDAAARAAFCASERRESQEALREPTPRPGHFTLKDGRGRTVRVGRDLDLLPDRFCERARVGQRDLAVDGGARALRERQQGVAAEARRADRQQQREERPARKAPNHPFNHARTYGLGWHAGSENRP